MKARNIEFISEGVDFVLNDKAKTTEWLLRAATIEKKKVKSITFIFVNDEYLYNMNVQYLNHDYYTDVITFPYHKNDEPIWGDVFISIDRVKENALSEGAGFNEELNRVMVHGLLHLVGFNDLTEKDKIGMNYKENYHLEHLIS